VIERGRDQKGDRHIKADVVIVGTGAGGGMAASELAGRGLSVVALEEGPYLEQKDMTQREVDMMGKLYQERGGRATADMAIRVLGGRCVGGSTVHNINLCKRTPKAILDTWAREHHVSGCSEKEMRPVFESVERELSVSEIPAGWRNANNQVLERGVKALGWKGGPLRHNRVGCQQSGFCELGCPFNAKQNSLKVLVPDALDHGAQVISDVRVSRIVHDGHRASGVIGAALGADGSARGRLVVDADVVVLAGSAIGSAMLGVQSGLPDPYDRLGRNLHMHPGIAVAGLFDDHIDGWKGIPQSYECMQLMDYNMNSDRRVWITTVFAHPIGAAVMLPGFGMEHREWMRRYRNIAVLTAMVHDETSGRVGVREDGRALIEYKLVDSDVHQFSTGIRACARLLFAGGAKKVLVPSVPPIVLDHDKQIDQIPMSAARPFNIQMAAVHPMGSMSLGDDPKKSVVKSTGEHHQVERLFVLDGSLFPTSLGAPPQISIYSFSRHLSKHVAERLSR
jgi:choline dehydrogenase-like flavoprotein